MSQGQTSQRTPSFIEVLQEIITARLYELHTSIPGKVVSYDYDKNLAVVQPALMRKYKTMNSAVELPTISNVPVMFQRFDEAFIRFPVKAGDTGMISFSERSLDLWLVQGGMIDPNDSRSHALADAVFIPGLVPNNNPMKPKGQASSLQIQYKDSYVEIKEDGEIKLENALGAKVQMLPDGKYKVSNPDAELFEQLVLLVENLIVAQVAIGSPFSADTIANLQQRLDKLLLLKG